MFSFGKDKKEARITGEFFVNAIHVMEGATSLENNIVDEGVNSELVVNNYLALTKKEAFRIEYWALEEAKLKRQPPEKEMARKIVVVVGGGNGIGKQLALKVAEQGAHVVIADLDLDSALDTSEEIKNNFGDEISTALKIDISNRESVHSALRKAALQFGGIDILVNTAALIIPPNKGNSYTDESWDKILRVNVTSNYILAEEFSVIIETQNKEGVLLLTSSANAVVPKSGSEPYDVSKAAVNHLIRELAIRFSPKIRVNGVSPASVIEGSTMFPRDRVIANLSKYNIEFNEQSATEELVELLAQFYADRTLTRKPVKPSDVANALYFLSSGKSEKISGHIIPVDSGLKEAFLR
jgi:NAD(P)-dependent dehydrogenase (short-subunit alcohol dehydrogenase family)